MKAIITTAILVAFLGAHNATAAAPDDQLALGGVALAGAAAGGPIGLIVGVTLANHYLTQRSERKQALQQVGELDSQLDGVQQQLAAEQRRRADLLADLSELRTANAQLADDRRLLSELQFDVHFRTADSRLSDHDRARLAQLAGLLKRYPELSIELHGHADARGPDGLNDTLAMQRANAVAAVLIGLAVAEERISSFAYGKRNATAGSSDVDGLAYDRRVLVVLDADGTAAGESSSDADLAEAPSGLPSTTVAAADGDDQSSTLQLKITHRGASPASTDADLPALPHEP